MARKITLQTIQERFCNTQFNDNNYGVGGGLSEAKFASNRHEDARSDEGKLTLGEAAQLFKKATGLTTEEVKGILQYAVPNMEWHHAGRLPKSYGGGMKKTYFLNSEEICDAATNWDNYSKGLQLSKAAENKAAEEKRSFEERKLEYLKANAEFVERVRDEPIYFHLTTREMNGKYGWFDSTYKSYNLPEYYTGWKFESQEKYNEFLQIS